MMMDKSIMDIAEIINNRMVEACALKGMLHEECVLWATEVLKEKMQIEGIRLKDMDVSILVHLFMSEILDVSLDFLFCRTDDPAGGFYKDGDVDAAD